MKKALSCIVLFLLLGSLSFGQTTSKGLFEKVKDLADSKKAEVEEKSFGVSGRVYVASSGLALRRSFLRFVKIGYHTDDPEFLAKNGRYQLSSYLFTNRRDQFISNDRGEFSAKLTPGTYVLVVENPGILTPSLKDYQFDIFQKVVVTSGDITNLSIPVHRAGAISGFVRFPDGEPLVGAAIKVVGVRTISKDEFEFSEVEFSGETDDRGFYRIPGLSPGAYVVKAMRPVFHVKDEIWAHGGTINDMLVTYHPDKNEIFDATTVNVKLGDEKEDISIVFHDSELFETSGSVIDKRTKKPIHGINVLIKKKSFGTSKQSIASTRTDEKGSWSFKDLLPGSYIVSLEDKRYLSNENVKRLISKEKEFRVGKDQQEPVVVALEEGARIKGEIRLDKSFPVPSYAFLRIVSKDYQEEHEIEFGYWDGKTDEWVPKRRIEFEFDGLPEGTYKIIPTGSVYDYESEEVKQGFFPKSISYKGKRLKNGKFDLKKGADHNGFVVSMSNKAGRLNVEVQKSWEFASTYVYIVSESFEPNASGLAMDLESEATDSLGRTSFELAPGRYRVFASDQNLDDLETKERKLDWLVKHISTAESFKVMPDSKIVMKLEVTTDEK